jgi:hypothetical protein
MWYLFIIFISYDTSLPKKLKLLWHLNIKCKKHLNKHLWIIKLFIKCPKYRMKLFIKSPIEGGTVDDH